MIFGGASGDEESRTALKILRARFSDFRSPMDSIGVQNSDLADFTLSTQSEIPSLRSGRALRLENRDKASNLRRLQHH